MWTVIEKILKRNNLTIYKLSKISSVPESTLRNYRNGSEPSFKNMCKIADALNISLDDLREKRQLRSDNNGFH